jgi:hypothetical protein
MSHDESGLPQSQLIGLVTVTGPGRRSPRSPDRRQGMPPGRRPGSGQQAAQRRGALTLSRAAVAGLWVDDAAGVGRASILHKLKPVSLKDVPLGVAAGGRGAVSAAPVAGAGAASGPSHCRQVPAGAATGAAAAASAATRRCDRSGRRLITSATDAGLFDGRRAGPVAGHVELQAKLELRVARERFTPPLRIEESGARRLEASHPTGRHRGSDCDSL